jgi:hypothetical protein
VCACIQATVTVWRIFAQWARCCQVCVFRGYIGSNSRIAAGRWCPLPVLDVVEASKLCAPACFVAMTRKACASGSPVPFEKRRPVLSRSWQRTRRDGGFVPAGPCVAMSRYRTCCRMRAPGCRSSEHRVCPNNSHLCREQPGFVFLFLWGLFLQCGD